MKFTITVEDRDNGMVRVLANPDRQTLIRMAKERDLTPAAGYALGALAHIHKQSIENKKAEVKERYERGEIPMFNSERRMFT